MTEPNTNEFPVLLIYNQHSADSGLPHYRANTDGKYYGYFANEFGEQWVFVFDFETRSGLLYGSDVGWD
jgi:hypothetical protein